MGYRHLRDEVIIIQIGVTVMPQDFQKYAETTLGTQVHSMFDIIEMIGLALLEVV